MAPVIPRGRGDFRIAIFCALVEEANWVLAVFDQHWKDEGRDFGKAVGDSNEYTIGVIGHHNVVLIHMPNMGKVSAATVAANLRFSYPNIELALIVGICGGVPFDPENDNEIILGDVIISQALVQYDLGRQLPGSFMVKDTLEESLARPNQGIRSFFARLKTNRNLSRLQFDVNKNLEDLMVKFVSLKYWGTEWDRLYEPTCVHKHHSSSFNDQCSVCTANDESVCQSAGTLDCNALGCDQARLVQRQCLSDSYQRDERPLPTIHFGRMASGDAVMKSAVDRDKIAQSTKVIGFEMEGAGIWDHFPSIVIKGVCDYADSHKNKMWQPYAAATAACGMKALLREWMPPEIPESEQVSHEAIWHVPFNRMQDFIGRESVLDQIETKLFPQSGLSIVALAGLGGVGKSRIAWEIATRARSNKPALSIFWVQATTESTFEKDCSELGKVLQIPGCEDEQANVKQLVRQYLLGEISGRWLMILDNADDDVLWSPRSASESAEKSSSSLVDFLPKSSHGSILVTTRSRQVAIGLAGKEVIELGEMNPEEAVDTLRSVLVDPKIVGDVVTTREVVKELSYLPLALTQAGAYINMVDCSMRDYLGLLRSMREEETIELLSANFEDAGRYATAQNAVANTWVVSFEKILRQHPEAASLLSFMACLHENNIPQTFLPIFSTQKNALEAIGILKGYSFVQKQNQHAAADQMYSMHRLVRIATRNWLATKKMLLSWTDTTIRRVAQVFPRIFHAYHGPMRRLCKLYMPHAQALCASKGVEHLIERQYLLISMSQNAIDAGNYGAAVQMSKPAAKFLQRELGSTHHETLLAYKTVGSALRCRGEYSESSEYFQKSYEGLSKTLGPYHPHTLINLQNLGYVYADMGRWDAAEPIIRNTIIWGNNTLGPGNGIAEASKITLVSLLRHRGEIPEAKRLSIEILQSMVRSYGAEDPHALRAKSIRAAIHVDEHEYTEAERLLKECLEVGTRVLGPEHPDVGRDLFQLGSLYRCMGRFAEGEIHARQALALSNVSSGPQSANTLSCKFELAEILKHLKKWAEVESIELEIYQARGKTLGQEDRYTLRSLATLATTRWYSRRHEPSVQVFKQVLDTQTRRFGLYDRDVLLTMEHLSGVLCQRGMYQESFDLLQRCVDLSEKVPGPDHSALTRRRGQLDRFSSWALHPPYNVVPALKYDIDDFNLGRMDLDS